MYEFELRLMRLGYFQPWGFHLRGGLSRPLVVDRVFPWSPACGWLLEGDQVCSIEGHLDVEIISEEAEALASLKSRYLRLQIRRLPMFSNQYMGTRLASRSLPRPASSSTYNPPGPYTRLNSYQEFPRPVNARPIPDDDEEVDYSFNKLPVRERRKLFLAGDRPSRFQSAPNQSMTMPRIRAPSHPPARYETQSDYGGLDDAFGWEQSVTPTWTTGARSAPNFSSTKKSSTTGVILLSTPRTATPVQRPSDVAIRHHSQYATGPFSPSSPQRPQNTSPVRYYTIKPPQTNKNMSYQPQYSTTIRVHDPYATSPQGKVICNGNTRVYPARRYPATMGPQAYGYNNSSWQTRPTNVSGRVVQPLRVNVYSSDSSTVHCSPPSRITNATPVYPAYPANLERSFHVETHTQSDRFRRGQSVQPVTVYSRPTSPIYHRAESQQVWRPLQASNWVATEPPRRQGRFISSPRSPIIRQRQPELQEQPGVSEF